LPVSTSPAGEGFVYQDGLRAKTTLYRRRSTSGPTKSMFKRIRCGLEERREGRGDVYLPREVLVIEHPFCSKSLIAAISESTDDPKIADPSSSARVLPA
jgi:hypothetical protein